jgi:hypothetical protein
VNIFSEILFGPDSSIIHVPIPQQLDQYPDDLRPVELITGRTPGVIAQVVEEPKVPWGKNELDAVFDRLCFGGRDCVLGSRIWLLPVLGPTEGVIPASGKWIFT